MRIGEQVEFRHRRNVAAVEVRTAHDHHFLDAPNDPRLAHQRQGKVGLRPQHGDGDALGPGGQQRVDQEVDRAALGQTLLRLMDRDARQTFFAVDVLGIDRRAFQRLRRPGIHRHRFAPGPLKGKPGIARGFVQAHVAGDRGQCAHVQFLRRCQGKQQGNHIVGTGIGIDDQVDRLWCLVCADRDQNVTPATSTMLQ
ncbi:hypothetical protein D3C73_1045780 [compost metagenome]